VKLLVLPGDGIGPEMMDATCTADLDGKLGSRAFARHVASLIR